MQFRLPTQKRNVIGLGYSDSYVRTDANMTDRMFRENNILSHSMDFSLLVFQSIKKRTKGFAPYARDRYWQLFTANHWAKGVETYFSLQGGRRSYGDPHVGYKEMPSFGYLTLLASLRLGWNERIVDRHFHRFHFSGGKPTVWVNFEAGEYKTDLMNRHSLYAHLSVMLKHKIDFTLLGTLDYAVKAGYIFGKTPYPFLQQMQSNTSYAFDPLRFTLAGPYSYMMDKYIFLHANWNMKGILFNRIPGIRYLHLRELLEFKLAYGGLRQNHNDVLPLPATTKNLHIPYIEAGVGIGNILRVGELYAVFRLTHNKNNDISFWGIRFRLNFEF